MKFVDIQFTPWEKGIRCYFDGLQLAVGDYVIVNTGSNVELGKLTAVGDVAEDELAKLAAPASVLERRATEEDLSIAMSHQKQKGQAFDVCHEMIKKHGLPIKLVDVYYSFDGGKITFAFVADGRVDFRELLKDLTKTFQKSIRLQQIGIRDEIKVTGDIGCCGRNLCCQGFFKDLGNVTSDLAELQQIAHRGADRLSGVCGRLKCCLRYEKELYEQLADNLPMIGETVKTKYGRGEVMGWHVLKQTIDVLLEDKETIVEVPIEK